MSMDIEALFKRDYPPEDSEIQQFVQHSITAKAHGDVFSYQQLCDTIKSGGDGGPHQLSLLRALTKCTASLTKKDHHAVVSVVLNNCWRGGEAVVDAAEVFAVNCVSVNAELVPTCISALAKQFLEIPVSPPPQRSEPQGGDDEKEAVLSHGVHRVLSRVIETFPTGSTTLLQQLKDRFPHKRRDLEMQRCFLENALQVLEYVPQILAPLLDEVIDRMVQIDVEIVVEDFVGDADGGQEGGDELFDMELPKSKEQEENAERAGKLDVMMLLTLDFIKTVCDASKPPIHRDALFQTLLDIFERRILTTFRSKYTQFLIFYASHFRTRYIQNLLSHLLKITTATGNNFPDATLLAASCYCGSFLARAGFARLRVTATALRLLATWLDEYIDAHDTDPDPATHSHFYVVAQSLMYALCFKMSSLVNDTKHITLVKLELRIDKVVACRLNPLKVVNASVAGQFVKALTQNKVLDRALLEPILRRNANLVVRGAAELAEEMSFFPFDPYLLKASKPHIEAIYHDWQGEADSDEEDEEWVAGIGSNSEPSASASSRHHSMIEESIAMSLSSQLSLSDAHSDGNNSPSWKPMSFSPPSDHSALKAAIQQQALQRKPSNNIAGGTPPRQHSSPATARAAASPVAGAFLAAPGMNAVSASVPVPNGVPGGGEDSPSSKRKRAKRQDD